MPSMSTKGTYILIVLTFSLLILLHNYIHVLSYRVSEKKSWQWMHFLAYSRKKSAGISHWDPLHGELFFSTQSEVDQFVADSGNTKSKSHSKVWHTFKYYRCTIECLILLNLCRIVNVMTFSLVMYFIVLTDIWPLMRLLFSVAVVVMSFPEYSLI